MAIVVSGSYYISYSASAISAGFGVSREPVFLEGDRMIQQVPHHMHSPSHRQVQHLTLVVVASSSLENRRRGLTHLKNPFSESHGTNREVPS